MTIDYQPFDEMTLAELRAEAAQWDRLLVGSPGWGTAHDLAHDCREQCRAWIARREREATGVAA